MPARGETMTWRGLLTWLGLRKTPLRRTSDRIEVAARWVALAALMGSLLLAVVVAGSVESRLRTDANERLSQVTPTVATLLEDAPRALAAPPEHHAQQLVRISWVTADGESRTGLLEVSPSAQRGDRVEVFLSAQGSLAAAPPTPAQISSRSAVAGCLAILLTSVAAVGALALTRRTLEAPRQRYWERAWDLFDGSGSGRPRA